MDSATFTPDFKPSVMPTQVDALARFGKPITYHPATDKPGALFSILIPTWNNLPYLRCCIASILKNSSFPHQIILHVNEGADGSREWAAENGLDYTFSAQNVGICHAVNAAAQLARTDYILYLNDDMYCCPGWDAALWAAIEQAGTSDFFISATLIEPVESGNNCVLAPYDFGGSPETFQEQALLDGLTTLGKSDWSGATWPPNVVPRRLWNQVGGYSLEFSPGMYSDPDFSAKLWLAGVRYFRGVGSSLVYHFMSKSTGRVHKPVKGNKLFVRKWGITSSAFTKYHLKRGQDWAGPLPEPEENPALRWENFKGRLKRVF